MSDIYLKAIKEGIAEYKRVSTARAALDAQMQKLLQLVAANVNMLPDDEQEHYLTQLLEMTPPSGLSEAILRVLKTDEWLNPIEVRDKLIEGGYDFAGQVNPLASIHTTLKRLVPEDAIANTPQPDGKTYYKKTETGRGMSNLERLYSLMKNPGRTVPLRSLVEPMPPRTRPLKPFSGVTAPRTRPVGKK